MMKGINGVGVPERHSIGLFLTRQALHYSSYVVLSFPVVCWSMVSLVLLGFYSEELLVKGLRLAVSLAGDDYSRFVGVENLRFSSSPGKDDIDFAAIVMSLFGRLCLILVVAGAVIEAIIRRPISVSPIFAIKAITVVALAFPLLFLLSPVLADETGLIRHPKGDPYIAIGIMSLLSAVGVWISGVVAVAINTFIGFLMKMLDEADQSSAK